MQLKIIFQLLLCAFCTNALSAQTDLIPFRQGNLWGFSKPDKTIVIPCLYDEVRLFENHNALIRKGLFYGLPCIYRMILNQDTDKNAPLMVQDKAGKWGLVDSKTYQWIFPCQYESITKVRDDLYMVKNQEIMYYVHKNGTAYFL
jgi:hypothetical protein